jgi:hypothetical protein
MNHSSSLAMLAVTALVSGAASATQVAVGSSGLVIDVEFWGRQRISIFDPGTNDDVVTYGDPVQGTFRIFADDAPLPTNTIYSGQDAKIYGQDRFGGNQGSFVTSHWQSPLPDGFAHEPGPFPGSVASDYVTIGDSVRFQAGEPRNDWLVVSDTFDDNGVPGDGLEESLSIYVRTPHDVIEGTGLDQGFDIDGITEEGAFTFGRLQTIVDGTNKVFDFVVDRLRVSSPHVCRP